MVSADVEEVAFCRTASWRDMFALMFRDEDESEAITVRIWATSLQMLQMASHGEEQISRGRPICGNCMQPIDPKGHFCPKSNGHK